MRHGRDDVNLSPELFQMDGTRNKRKRTSVGHDCANHDYYHTKKRQRFQSESQALIFDSNTIQTHRHIYVNEKHSCKRQKHKKRGGIRSASTDDHRKWVDASCDFSSYRDKVVLLSYNILGVENASKHRDLYSNIPPHLLEWNRRKKLIHKEIHHYNPSLLCFQEVDRFDDLEILLQKDGFQGVYQARTGEACDGCAIFWKNEIFSVMHQETIKFENFGLRNNVAQLCVLEMTHSTDSTNTQTSVVQPSRSLVVGNIHVLFNPSRGDIKLGQVRLFLEKAHKLSQEWGRIPIILAGDFNSVPKSPMYQFLASSELDIQLYDRRKISSNICPPDNPAYQFQSRNATSFCMSISRSLKHKWSDEELRLAAGTERVTYLLHHLKLRSAYAGVHGSLRTRDNLGEPLATSYHSKFMGTVDYIWHTEELVSVRVLETLTIDVLRKTGGLPSKKWGSDHLALVCELAFADASSRT